MQTQVRFQLFGFDFVLYGQIVARLLQWKKQEVLVMAWELSEAISYYGTQGAPADQTALTNLLREVQQEFGAIPAWTLAQIAEQYQIKETFLQAIIRRIPSLRLEHAHCLELCGGPNCSKRAQLAAFIEKTYGSSPTGFTLRHTGCMRMCGKGPNLKWDGKVYNQADEDLIRRLVEGREAQ